MWAGKRFIVRYGGLAERVNDDKFIAWPLLNLQRPKKVLYEDRGCAVMEGDARHNTATTSP